MGFLICSSLLLTIKLVLAPHISAIDSAKWLSYSADIGVILLSALTLLRNSGSKKRSFQVLLLILSLNGLIALSAIVNEANLFESMANSARTLGPLLYFFALLSLRDIGSRKIGMIGCYVVTASCVLAVIGFATLPNAVNRDETWWPAYFDGLHSSSYVLFACALIGYVLLKHRVYRQGWIKLLVIASILFCSWAFLFAWGVRTVIFASVIGYLLYRFRARYLVMSLILAIVVAGQLYGTVGFNYGFADLDLFSSGRLSMYQEKVNQLSRNDIAGWMIGNGYGSDLIQTDVWWWAEKGAHNDFLTFLVENGALYVCIFCLLLWVLLRACKGYPFAICMAYSMIFTSLVSNGYFVRPLPAYIMFLALYMSMALSRRPLPIHSRRSQQANQAFGSLHARTG
ncbi:hypothetical protein D8I24_7948 [Cupriavidus necator H850]|uniref:O-antigen ligase family protein n=1 Tax=Cupriavidus necator TaxID=106590 RepID=UPI00129DF6A4|nr:hypothetical protein [Cupriavidus necator]KAI3595327.1 hypothetical protein D8I24_7948 [Cupriavidus necator H850]